MKKLNVKILIAVFIGLIGVFVLSRVFHSPGLEGNLKKSLIAVDTASVTEVKIQPAKNRANEIRLVKEGKTWQVATDKQKSLTDIGSVKSMLGVLLNLKTQRMASRKKDKWETYNVGDKGTHVSVFAGSKKVADINFGKTGFTKGGGGPGGYGSAFTYVRLSDENEVYTVDGFLESHFNRSFNDWRNKAFLRVKKDDITKLTFKYPADSGFVLNKRDSLWYVGNEKGDLNKVQGFLGQLAFKNMNDFAEGFVAPASAPFTFTIEGQNGVLASVEGWKTGDQWTLKSTEQNGVYFSATESVVKDLMVGKKRFLTGLAEKAKSVKH